MSLRCCVEGRKAEMGGAKGEEVGVSDMSGSFCFPGVDGRSEDDVDSGASVAVVPWTSCLSVS